MTESPAVRPDINKKDFSFVFAAKCAADEKIFGAIAAAGLSAVELYTDSECLKKTRAIAALCRKFPFRYALHAPNDSLKPEELAELTAGIQAEAIVFHDIFWEDEWATIQHAFQGLRAKICVENSATINQPLKFMRRFGMGLCLDLEHLQMEIGGVFPEEFVRVMKKASHVHLSGYSFGSNRWHSPIHHAPEHTSYLLQLLRQAGYRGMIVSEAQVAFQTTDEFTRLESFIRDWTRANEGQTP